ncbi:2-oxo acid dehydrogenase subunit E2 [Prauserella muralis]|uniref:2-oxo acid dehydrogenase n=1 Tax=Prauserella muralis TaxID=588067 RepID=A0A2V4ASV7_9PSEU|nr:2-oxo acid dehydrogenase subunit E2 [Prauserella muralis]PXY22631.1 2-oxo acid dehydrogenase [Prauserella muralis]TWE28341.1 pyruvate dehydrogenase E2 component (dihydrolipoamide acetyltransferase) [Prauserella muralis]
MADRLRGWRKLAGATWTAPKDPQFYGELELDAAGLLDYVDTARSRSGVHLTVTHLVGRAVAVGLAEVPALAVRLSRGRAWPRESIDVFFIVATGDGEELTGVKVDRANRKSAIAIARELHDRVAAIGRGDDADFGRSKALLERLPAPLMRLALRGAAWLTSGLNLDLSRAGMPRQAFGSAMITSVGMWGVERAFSPLAPYYRVPLLVLVGAVTQRPVVRDGEVVVRPMLTLTATFDHRYADGAHAARFAAAIRRYCADPAAFEPAD